MNLQVKRGCDDKFQPLGECFMLQWFSAGYFTMNLQVKRGCDDKFQPLGECFMGLVLVTSP